MTVETETLLRVYAEDGKGACLEIGEWPDAPGFLELRTPNPTSKEWFGEMGMSMSPDFAAALGQALIRAAAEMKK